jgi:hypothetical protein
MVKKNNTKKMIWDITNVKSVEDIKPSLTKAKILNSGINISELEGLIEHAINTVLTDIKKDVKKITPWYKKLWNWITRKK